VPSAVTQALWARYRADGDPAARAQLLDAYLGLVHHAARELVSRVGGAEYDDLLGAGTLGLVQALDGFDAARGLAFSTFAMPRIRGAILDDLRRRDWLPRSARDRGRRLADARQALAARLEREPTEDELASELGVSLRLVRRWSGHAEPPSFVPLDQPVASGGGTTPLHEMIPDPRAPDPSDAVGSGEQLAVLADALAALPERERLVLMLSYYEELNLKQIGEVLQVTASRASQLRTRALQRLRAFAAWEEAA